MKWLDYLEEINSAKEISKEDLQILKEEDV